MKKIIVIIFAMYANMAIAKEGSLGTLNGERLLRLDEITFDVERVCKDETAPSKIKISCLNVLLFPTMLNEWQFKNSLPQLRKYVETSTPLEIEGYLLDIENLLQLNAEIKDTLNKSETIQVISAILNIESIFMEFDRDQDNFLNYEELLNIYQTYKSEFILAAKIRLEQEKYSQSLFLYQALNMIELKDVDNLKFYPFHQCVSMDYCRNKMMSEFQINRKKIAYILSHI